jgi:mRNA turnover protein 4
LSKTKKKGREQKESLVSTVRQCLDEYASLYVFTFENMRNGKFKELREKMKESSRFFLGSNKVLQIALGKTAAEEVKEDVHKASEMIHGDCGLFFTNLPKEEVEKLFEEFEAYDFSRTGSLATQTVELNEGPLEQFSHDMEPFLRKQGMPVRLNRSVVELVADYTVCREGEHISPEASRILRLLGIQLAAFKVHLLCLWRPGEFHVYEGVPVKTLSELHESADEVELDVRPADGS